MACPECESPSWHVSRRSDGALCSQFLPFQAGHPPPSGGGGLDVAKRGNRGPESTRLPFSVPPSLPPPPPSACAPSTYPPACTGTRTTALGGVCPAPRPHGMGVSEARLSRTSPMRGTPWAPKALFGSGRQAQSPKPPPKRALADSQLPKVPPSGVQGGQMCLTLHGQQRCPKEIFVHFAPQYCP